MTTGKRSLYHPKSPHACSDSSGMQNDPDSRPYVAYLVPRYQLITSVQPRSFN